MRKHGHSSCWRSPERRLLALFVARLVPRLEHCVEPPGGTADLGGSDRGQHGPLRVPQPGQAEHPHHRLQLDPR